jgi:hypothetical protein
MVVLNDFTTTSDATITANLGPGDSVSSLALTDVSHVEFDPYRRVLFLRAKGKEYEFQIPAGYVLTATWAEAGAFTLVVASGVN